jgi:hypothetical protein
VEEDLRALLLADAGVAAVVGTRVAWGYRPQGSPLPAVVLHIVGGTKAYHLSGESGPLQPRVQVNCLAESYLSALGVCRSVAAALSGYAGTVGGTYFQGILQDSEPRDLSDPDGATEERIFGLTVDFIVNHS